MLTNYSPAARRLLIANVIAFIGFGLTLQYPVIYLNTGRGIGLNEAGAILTFAGLLGLAISPIAGAMTDRYGARGVMLIAGVLTAAGSIAFAHVTTLIAAAVVWTVAGMAQSARFPAMSTLLGVHVTESQRSSAFALNYAGINLGIGLGGLMGGFIIDPNDIGTFQTASYIQAAFTLLFIVLTWQVRDDRHALRKPSSQPINQSTNPPLPENVWRDMVRNRPFILLGLMNLLFWGTVSQQNSFLPLYAIQDLNATPRVLGLALGLNTLVIAVLQMPVMRWLTRISKRWALVIMYVGIGLGWGLMLLAGAVPKGQLPMLLVVLTPGIIGLAETVFSPIVPPWVLRVAPPEQLGRYNGMVAMLGGIAVNAGPFIATLFVQANASAALLWLLIGTCVVGIGVVAAMRE